MTAARSFVAVVALVLAAGAARAADAVPPERLAEARASVSALADALKGQLSAAIAAGGPASAVGVCRSIAPAVSDETSKARGVAIKRTALRVRNHANAPDDFELEVLKEFAAKADAGADLATLEYAKLIEDGTGRYLRYMKPIPMAAEPCLACHGADLKPEVKEAIARLYPDDKATGFKPGELRGAFSIIDKRPLP